jgi:hypothetical protein
VTVSALRQNLFINNDGISLDKDCFFVTHVTSNFRVPTLERKVRPRVVIEDGGDPALRIMAIGTGGLSGSCKLSCMSILVTVLTNLCRALELNCFRTYWHLVAGAATDNAVRS